MGPDREWMVVLQCPCTPDENIIITHRKMRDGLVVICSLCKKPLVILGSDGHLYLVGEIIIMDAKNDPI
ncbi:hypothetical protein [Ammoniphilus sp. CFH 90114]|uniref:hypothetical protein n=1 Tax=Ammoniphilus sp. CFH 90114 TaxID=2493665 RepID=UPI00100F8B0A|nr:hypothetical protein [Ammoniphilus sp. CFH 90114]RXT15239.1 hypothetical protein EIZ39_03240 [Ammoniphilus sp. CFH 90114]